MANSNLLLLFILDEIMPTIGLPTIIINYNNELKI
jgi:hypothetical protein